MSEPDRYAHLLELHLDVNPKSWAALTARGIDEDTPLALDFEFTAPGEDETRELMRHLGEATDYEYKGGARDMADGTRRWLVIGTTPAETWSLEKLDAWVTEMTVHGRDHGSAEFDGWGVQTPSPQGAPPPPASLAWRDLLRRRRAR